jgi:hypothetical protein
VNQLISSFQDSIPRHTCLLSWSKLDQRAVAGLPLPNVDDFQYTESLAVITKTVCHLPFELSKSHISPLKKSRIHVQWGFVTPSTIRHLVQIFKWRPDHNFATLCCSKCSHALRLDRVWHKLLDNTVWNFSRVIFTFWPTRGPLLSFKNTLHGSDAFGYQPLPMSQLRG